MKKLRKTVKRQQQQRKIYFNERLAGKIVKNDEVKPSNLHDISTQNALDYIQKSFEDMWKNGVKI